MSLINLSASTIRVAAASNISYAMDDLKKEFYKRNKDIKVQVILGGTGKLATQIRNKAPFDMLMGADMFYVQKLYEEGYASTKPVVYAQGSLVYLSGKKLDFSDIKKLLLSKDIKKIALANPKTAPYGKASVEFLKNVKLFEILKPKFVYAESISQTFTYAIRVADMGLVAKSLLFSPKMRYLKEGVNYLDVDAKFYTPIKQGMVMLSEAKHKADAKLFYDFMLSKEARDILKRYGYILP
jgi:molybdate transport system substrate-binding protein